MIASCCGFFFYPFLDGVHCADRKPSIFRSIKLKRSRTCRFIKFNSVYTNYRVQGATLSGARTYYGVIKFFTGWQ